MRTEHGGELREDEERALALRGVRGSAPPEQEGQQLVPLVCGTRHHSRAARRRERTLAEDHRAELGDDVAEVVAALLVALALERGEELGLDAGLACGRQVLPAAGVLLRLDDQAAQQNQRLLPQLRTA